MLELRYNGCSDCLSTAKTLLRNAGLFSGRDYKVEHHQDHRTDKIYTVRPDYIKITSGAIIYNPDNQSWIDVYDSEHMKCVLCGMSADDLRRSIDALR